MFWRSAAAFALSRGSARTRIYSASARSGKFVALVNGAGAELADGAAAFPAAGGALVDPAEVGMVTIDTSASGMTWLHGSGATPGLSQTADL